MRDGGLGLGLGHFWLGVAVVPRNTFLLEFTNDMLLPFDHSFVSELQQEGISRYDCDSQKCDIALRTICLKTFGGRS